VNPPAASRSSRADAPSRLHTLAGAVKQLGAFDGAATPQDAHRVVAVALFIVAVLPLYSFPQKFIIFSDFPFWL
jgi:hypothetical protein